MWIGVRLDSTVGIEVPLHGRKCVDLLISFIWKFLRDVTMQSQYRLAIKANL